ncbi:TPA: hypothetical protein ACG354_000878 [Escherichia coli]|nr:hypothetical protein [Escherichia coli]HBE3761070.1 hypothetical protein [Escherichia coli]
MDDTDGAATGSIPSDAIPCDAKSATATCPLKPFGAFVEFDSSTAEGQQAIEDFYKNTASFMGSFFEPVDKKTSQVHLQRGIPLRSLNNEITRYATMQDSPDLTDAERNAIETAKEIAAMDNFFDTVRKQLGDEEFLNFALLFDEQARESADDNGFAVKYKGGTVQLEDAKFKLKYYEAGANIIPYYNNDYHVEHVRTHGSTFWGDNFVVEVAPDIYIYKDFGLLTEPPFEYDATSSDEQQKANPFEDLGTSLIYGESTDSGKGGRFKRFAGPLNKQPEPLAEEFIRAVLNKADENRSLDVVRDVVLEVADAVLTIAAIVSGTILLKAAVSGSMKVFRIAMLVVDVNHGIEAVDKLRNRWLGSKADGYNPLLEFSRYLDKKSGGGHSIEVAFHALNTLMVFGKKPQYKFASALVTSGGGAYLGSKVALVNEVEVSSMKIENEDQGVEK